MPYGQLHYPFENKSFFEGGAFPADFVAEGEDCDLRLIVGQIYTHASIHLTGIFGLLLPTSDTLDLLPFLCTVLWEIPHVK